MDHFAVCWCACLGRRWGMGVEVSGRGGGGWQGLMSWHSGMQCMHFLLRSCLLDNFGLLLWCCAVWRPQKVSPYMIIVQVIFYFLWDHWAHPGYFENRIPLKPALGAYAASQTIVLHMKRLNLTESPIFVILCVLCFQKQRQFILLLFDNTWCNFFITIACMTSILIIFMCMYVGEAKDNTYSLTLSTFSKKFSRRNFEIFFLLFDTIGFNI